MEKCKVERIRPGAKVSVEEKIIEAVPPEEPAARIKSLRQHAPLIGGADADASSLVAPENEIVMGVVFVLAIVLVCLLRSRQKNAAKTQ